MDDEELEDSYLPLFEPEAEVTIGDAAILLNDDIQNVMSALKNHTQVGNNNESIITSSSSPPTTLSPTPAPSSTMRPITMRPTTTIPSSGPTKSPEVVTLEPTPIPSSMPSKVPTNQVRIILNQIKAILISSYLSHAIMLFLIYDINKYSQ